MQSNCDISTSPYFGPNQNYSVNVCRIDKYYYEFPILQIKEPLKLERKVKATLQIIDNGSVKQTHEKIFTFKPGTDLYVFNRFTGNFSGSLDFICFIEDVTSDIAPIEKISLQSKIINDLKKGWLDDDSKDIIIKVDTETIKAHKFILKIRSPIFAKLLEDSPQTMEAEADISDPVSASQKDCKTTVAVPKVDISNEIEIKDLSYETLRSVVQFMYYDDCDKIAELKKELLYAADKYKIDDLKVKAGNEYLKQLKVGNALDTLLVLDAHNGPEEIITKVVKFIAKERMSIFKDANVKNTFLKANPHLAAKLYQTMLEENGIF